MMTKTTLIAFSCFMFFASCKPKEQETRHFVPGFLSYFDYQKGSYWIMEDQLSGVVDSFYVSGRSYDPGEKPINGDGDKWESISTIITRAGKPDEKWYLYLYLGIANFITTKARYEFLLNNGMYPLYPTLDILDSTYSSVFALKYHGRKQIIGSSVDAVYRCSEKDKDHNYYNDTVFFNRQHGFVEFDQHNGADNHRWTLIRSHIIR